MSKRYIGIALALAVGLSGCISIHRVAQRGDLEGAKANLDCGVDPNARGKYGTTPLHAAAHSGSVEIARLLVERGAGETCQEPPEPFLSHLLWAALAPGHKKGPSAESGETRASGPLRPPGRGKPGGLSTPSGRGEPDGFSTEADSTACAESTQDLRGPAAPARPARGRSGRSCG